MFSIQQHAVVTGENSQGALYCWLLHFQCSKGGMSCELAGGAEAVILGWEQIFIIHSVWKSLLDAGVNFISAQKVMKGKIWHTAVTPKTCNLKAPVASSINLILCLILTDGWPEFLQSLTPFLQGILFFYFLYIIQLYIFIPDHASQFELNADPPIWPAVFVSVAHIHLCVYMQMTNLADADVSEEDKIKVMINQSTYDSMKWVSSAMLSPLLLHPRFCLLSTSLHLPFPFS